MSRYDTTQLVKMWAQETLTSEQAIGQILQHLQALEERIKRVEQRAGSRNAPGHSAETDAPEMD